jgi:hypothetical protein
MVQRLGFNDGPLYERGEVEERLITLNLKRRESLRFELAASGMASNFRLID